MSKEETFYFDETLIDILWEVKEGKKHPNRAFKEINKYADQEVKRAVLKALEGIKNTEIVDKSKHHKHDDNVDNLPISEFSFRKGAMWLKQELRKRSKT